MFEACLVQKSTCGSLLHVLQAPFPNVHTESTAICFVQIPSVNGSDSGGFTTRGSPFATSNNPHNSAGSSNINTNILARIKRRSSARLDGSQPLYDKQGGSLRRPSGTALVVGRRSVTQRSSFAFSATQPFKASGLLDIF